MVYIDIPFLAENKRIDKESTRREIALLDINDDAKREAYAAIFNVRPRGVAFGAKQTSEAVLLEITLRRLGVPYRTSEESDNYFGQDHNSD